jgi:NADPH:quinone reductase
MNPSAHSQGMADMRAAQVLRLKGPEGVRLVDVAEPPCGTGQVLVDVQAVGVSFPDLLLSWGRYQVKPTVPFTIGIDFAGIIRTGLDGSGLRSGDRVAGSGWVGAAAEVVAAFPDQLFQLPSALSFAEGACLPMNYMTAHFALLTRADLRSGQVVLVHGAAGGVGTAAVQIAKAYGARVLAVVSAEWKAAAAKAAGADHVLLAAGFLDQVRDLTGNRGVDVVLDVVGSTEVVLDSLRVLAPRGRLLVVGFAAGEIASVKLNRLLLGNLDLRGVAWGSYTRQHPGFAQQQWNDLLPLLESGALKPVVGRTYELTEVRQALADIAGRQITGKAVLLVG